jgi:hypothetical protein
MARALAKVVVETLVGVDAQELSDNLYGEDLWVGELGSGTAPSDVPIFDLIIDEAEDGNDEGVKIHLRRPPLHPVLLDQRRAYGGLLFGSSPQKKRAHGIRYLLLQRVD